MRDILLDIVKHTHSLGFIQAVKIDGTDGSETNIEAMDDDRSVVLKGKLHNAVQDFNGVIGLGKLGVLILITNVGNKQFPQFPDAIR